MDKSMLDKSFSIIKCFKLLNKYAGAISILFSILLVGINVLVFSYNYGKIFSFQINIKDMSDYKLTISNMIMYIPLGIYIGIFLYILLLGYNKSIKKEYTFTKNSYYILILTILYITFKEILFYLKSKSYMENNLFNMQLFCLNIDFILIFLLIAICFFINNCNKLCVFKKNGISEKYRQKILSFIILFKYNTIFFSINICFISLKDLDILNYPVYITVLEIITSIALFVFLGIVASFFISLFLVVFDFKKHISNNFLKVRLKVKEIFLFLIIFLYLVIVMFSVGITINNGKKEFVKIQTINSSLNSEYSYIVLHETTDRYIVATYEEKGGKTTIFNKKLMYISKSENVSVEKIELKNIELESRMD